MLGVQLIGNGPNCPYAEHKKPRMFPCGALGCLFIGLPNYVGS
jgi:hypothetical protein